MATIKGYINIYRSGLYHTAGKPGAFDRHGGDIYPTKDAAWAAISPAEFFVDTCYVEWVEGEQIEPNADVQVASEEQDNALQDALELPRQPYDFEHPGIPGMVVTRVDAAMWHNPGEVQR